jgi:hypothetical protein
MERDEVGGAAQTLSHHNVLEYGTGAKEPFYLVPGQTPLELIGKWIDRNKDELYRLAKLGGSTGLLGVREATSGIAYAYEFNETNQSLANKAASIEYAEAQIHRLFLKWLQEEFSGTIIYPREFGVDDFMLELNVMTQARTALTTSTGIQTLEKKLCSKLFHGEDAELRKKIEDEVMSNDPKGPSVVEGFHNTPAASTQGVAE